MTTTIFSLVKTLKEENERLKKEKVFLSTALFDHRLVIRGLKKALEKSKKAA